MEKRKHKPMPKRKWGQPSLMEAIGFTEEDLEANQSGHLSQQQFARFEREKRRKSRGFFVSLIAGPMLCGLLGPAGLHDFVTSILNFLVIYGGGVLFTLILFIPYYRRVWSQVSAFEKALRTDEVRTVEGWANLDVEVRADEGGTVYTYAVSFEQMSFDVTKEVFLAFKNGDTYRIYYAPHSKTILSAEWLR